MIERTSSVSGAAKNYTVGGLYNEARAMLNDEIRKNTGAGKGPLPEAEQAKMDALAKFIANTVLKEMNLA